MQIQGISIEVFPEGESGEGIGIETKLWTVSNEVNSKLHNIFVLNEKNQYLAHEANNFTLEIGNKLKYGIWF